MLHQLGRPQVGYAPDRAGDPSNEVFRAYRYAADSPQIKNRLKDAP